MAQPSYAFHYLGSIEAKANTVYVASSIITQFPTANALKMKTNGTEIRVSINKTPAFKVNYDDESYIANDSTTYVFNADVIVAVGKYVAVT